MASSFQDHFSAHADAYVHYRPRYPDSLFDYLATLTGGQDLAWDCGTGNGQAAVGLARRFKQVIASDPSEQQIANAMAHPNVRYFVGAAEEPPAEAGGADLVTVAQALHWFDFDRFYSALRAVLKPGAVFAAWGYSLMQVIPAVDAVISHYYTNIIGPYWPADRRHIESAYQTIPFPLNEVSAPGFVLTCEWSLDALIGYLDTWSATQRYIQDRGQNPVELIRSDLVKAWGSAPVRTIVWPVFLRVGRFAS